MPLGVSLARPEAEILRPSGVAVWSHMRSPCKVQGWAPQIFLQSGCGSLPAVVRGADDSNPDPEAAMSESKPIRICRSLKAGLLLIIILGWQMLCFAQDGTMPFYPGEKLTFQLKWGFIPAGEAVLEVCPITTIEGTPAYHFVMTARTNAFLDLFYKVRDRIDAYTDLDVTHSLVFRQRQEEGHTRRNIAVDYNWKDGEATCTHDEEKKPAISLLPGCFDPLTIFYYARTQALKVNGTLERPVSDGKKCVLGRAMVKKRERLSVKGKDYDTFLIEPSIKEVGGVFKKSKNASIKVWVTADERHIPVRVKSKVAVGSFVGELEKVVRGEAPK
jgi:Protein of unknown function (DUF3108)